MLKTTYRSQLGEEYSEYLLGEMNGVKIVTILHKEDIKEDVDLRFLPEKVREKIIELGEEAKKPNLANMFIDPSPPKYELSHNQYYDLLALNESIYFNRSIPTYEYFGYLLQSLTVKELKKTHKQFDLSGYSVYNKHGLIDNLNLNLAEEEKIRWLMNYEKKVIQNEFNAAINLLNGYGKETLKEIKIINEDTHEIECTFEGRDWSTTNFLMINENSIDNPERDCDCRTGSEMGFCPHFWVAFMKSVKLQFFILDDWKLTPLPAKLSHYISNLKM